MSKKFATSSITNELKGSAWFRQPEPVTPPVQETSSASLSNQSNKPAPEPKTQPDSPTSAGESKAKDVSNTATQQYDNIASNIAILHFDEADMEALRQGTYQPQTFRLRREEVEWLKDQSYELSKELQRGKVGQVDLLRIGLRICYKLMQTNKEDLLKILKEMK